MSKSTNRWARRIASGAIVGLTSTSVAWAAAPAARTITAPPAVTEADVARSNEKLAQAYSPLVKMWDDNFSKIGARFVAPRLVRYRGAARTACGIMGSGNAAYCSSANTVYYDEVFVAAQEKAAGSRLGTDGDMAGIGIIAHEIGHAVAIQLGDASRDSYENESTADCLAGAFALQAQKDGQLENGDLDEAFFGMAAAGDPTVELTGNQRVDQRITSRMQRMAHGTSAQRTSNFKEGYEAGAGGCLPEFAGRGHR
jgi:predicted metalloprotease